MGDAGDTQKVTMSHCSRLQNRMPFRKNNKKPRPCEAPVTQ